MIARLFIGVPVESATVGQVAKTWRNDLLLNHSRMNWVKPENWHITLFFLGNQQISSIALLQRLIEESFCAVKVFSTQVIGIGVFPGQSKPKVLWIGLENLEMLMPARNMLGELLLKNGFAVDKKPLKPHLTLARMKSPGHSSYFDSFLTHNRQFSFGPVSINRIVLYESILSLNGPVYKPLFVLPFEIV